MTEDSRPAIAPRVFISYSHDTPAHKQWVLNLAIRLRQAGVDATLDQWDLRLGEDVARFMESGIRECGRVIVVLSSEYVRKANEGKGGVGYEKQIVTKQLIEDLGTNKFIPIIRGNPGRKVPDFLGYRLYLDFEDESQYDINVDLLLRELHDVPPPDKPPLGRNPFSPAEGEQPSHAPEATLSKASFAVPASPDPAADAAGINELKELLSDPKHRVRLHDWLRPRVDEAINRLRSSEFSDCTQRPTDEMFRARLEGYDAVTRPLARIFAVFGFWANDDQVRLLGEALARFAAPTEPSGASYEVWLYASRYPALKLLYAAGVGMAHAENLKALKYLTLGVSVKARLSQEDETLLIALNRDAPFAQDFWKWLPGLERRYFPLSSHLERVLRAAYSDLIPDDHAFVRSFDWLEFLAALLYGDSENEKAKYGFWIPLGSFVWRRPKWPGQFKEKIEKEGKNWLPLRHSFCNGDPERALTILDNVQEFLGSIRRARGMF